MKCCRILDAPSSEIFKNALGTSQRDGSGTADADLLGQHDTLKLL